MGDSRLDNKITPKIFKEIDYEDDVDLDKIVEIKINQRALIVYTSDNKKLAIPRHILDNFCKKPNLLKAHMRFNPDCKACKKD